MTTDAVAGLAFPLDCAGLGAFGMARGIEKLEQRMKLIVQTYPGERVMRSDFGCRLRDYLFESMTPATSARLADEVERSLAAWEPQVQVVGVAVTPDESVDGLLRIVITYRLRATGEVRDQVVDFSTDRHHLPVDAEPVSPPAGDAVPDRALVAAGGEN